MKRRWKGTIFIAFIYFFSHLGFWGCSSAQSEGDEDLESSEESSENTDEGEGNESADSQGEETSENASSETNEATNDASNAAGENPAAQQQNDLQEIISEVNENMGQDPAAQQAEAAPTSNVAPVDTSVTQSPTIATETTQASEDVIGDGASTIGLPEFGSKMPYQIQKGESLAKIAKKIYGNAARWKDIAEISGISKPNRIYPGQVIYYQLTQQSLEFAKRYESVPREEFIVKQGDTLSKIATQLYGSTGMWRTLWKNNEDVNNPDRIKVGQVISYPEPKAYQAALESLSTYSVSDLSLEDQNTDIENGFELSDNIQFENPSIGFWTVVTNFFQV